MLGAQRAPGDVQGTLRHLWAPQAGSGRSMQTSQDALVTQQGSGLKGTMEGVVADNYLTIISVE